MDKKKEMKSLNYYIQTLLGSWLHEPIIPKGKTTGFSLVRSEREQCKFGRYAYAIAPFVLHRVELGERSYFARNASATNLKVGKFCSIGPNFCCGQGIHPTDGISTHPMFYRGKTPEYKQTIIGNDVFIGANVTVLDGVKIGDGAVIGAGAVVARDIPDYAVAVGVPARVVKYRFTDATIAKLQQIQWWNWDDSKLKQIKAQEFDVDTFVAENI